MDKAVVRLAGASLLAIGLSACSMGNMLGGAAPAPQTQQLQNSTATAADIAAMTPALPAIATECPPIKVRPGQEALFFYGNGKVGNAQDLQYQAVIDKQSRNCVVSNGKISVELGAAGRLLLGPSGTQTNVELPLRFTVERDGTALFSELYQIPASITPGTQTGEFVKVVPKVEIPYLGGESLIIWVGFDANTSG